MVFGKKGRRPIPKPDHNPGGLAGFWNSAREDSHLIHQSLKYKQFHPVKLWWSTKLFKQGKRILW
jgi:hypothetical protein